MAWNQATEIIEVLETEETADHVPKGKTVDHVLREALVQKDRIVDLDQMAKTAHLDRRDQKVKIVDLVLQDQKVKTAHLDRNVDLVPQDQKVKTAHLDRRDQRDKLVRKEQRP